MVNAVARQSDAFHCSGARPQGPYLADFSRMTRIAFFGHDAADAAVRRRVQGFRDDGLDVVGFTMRRRDDVQVDWENVDLGRTFDGAYSQRIKSIFSGAKRAAAQRDLLASADVIYARNLDMLATAFLAKRYARLKTPVIYEALDVHRLLTRKDLIGLALRRIEGALLGRTKRLVVSSPGFLENYFEVRHRGRYRPWLIENRLAPVARREGFVSPVAFVEALPNHPRRFEALVALAELSINASPPSAAEIDRSIAAAAGSASRCLHVANCGRRAPYTGTAAPGCAAAHSPRTRRRSRAEPKPWMADSHVA